MLVTFVLINYSWMLFDKWLFIYGLEERNFFMMVMCVFALIIAD